MKFSSEDDFDDPTWRSRHLQYFAEALEPTAPMSWIFVLTKHSTKTEEEFSERLRRAYEYMPEEITNEENSQVCLRSSLRNIYEFNLGAHLDKRRRISQPTFWHS